MENYTRDYTKQTIRDMKPGKHLNQVVYDIIFTDLQAIEKESKIELPDYSTDMTEAWKVALEMEKRYGFPYQGQDNDSRGNGFMLMKVNGQKWYCEFSNPEWEEAEGDTPAEAICKAALFSVMAVMGIDDVEFE
jgi:hypothetical protein